MHPAALYFFNPFLQKKSNSRKKGRNWSDARSTRKKARALRVAWMAWELVYRELEMIFEESSRTSGNHYLWDSSESFVLHCRLQASCSIGERDEKKPPWAPCCARRAAGLLQLFNHEYTKLICMRHRLFLFFHSFFLRG